MRSSSSEKPIVIVGGGLSGMLLAFWLTYYRQKVILWDNFEENKASSVAAGLFNVITGKRANLTWQAEEMLEAINYFVALNSDLAQYYHFTRIFRPFVNAFECNQWASQSAELAYQNYITLETQPNKFDDFEAKLGGIWIENCGWLDVNSFLRHLKHKLLSTGCFTIFPFSLNYNRIDVQQSHIRHYSQTYPFRALVFCDGLRVNQNPYRCFQPIRPLKGQLLNVLLPQLETNFILVVNRLFLIPTNPQLNQYTIGSTYEVDFADEYPDQFGLETLISALKNISERALSITILKHLAGVRPTTGDRRPLMGHHPEYPNIYFLNGMGTKGVLNAHYSSKILAEHLLFKMDIPIAIHLSRKAMQVFA